jgi:hypothetical protein
MTFPKLALEFWLAHSSRQGDCNSVDILGLHEALQYISPTRCPNALLRSRCWGVYT